MYDIEDINSKKVGGVIIRLLCIAIHLLKRPVASADREGAPVAAPGVVAIGEAAQAGAVAIGEGAQAGAVAIGARAGVLVVAGGAVVFAFAAVGSYLNRASASAGALHP